MFNYVTNVNELSHNIIREYLHENDIAIDATLGNGNDCDFLSEIFHKVYAFDIQKIAIDRYREKNKENVTLLCDSHEKLNLYVKESVNCIVFNLGFLPGGNKEITTKEDSTIKAIKAALLMLKQNGILTIGIYPGHEEGKREETAILEYLKTVPKNEFGILLHSFINRDNNPPKLIVIEKK